jgi:hypothetical protein
MERQDFYPYPRGIPITLGQGNVGDCSFNLRPILVFAQQARQGAPKSAARGIIGCGQIVEGPYDDVFSKTGDAGWFVDRLFEHFIDP